MKKFTLCALLTLSSCALDKGTIIEKRHEETRDCVKIYPAIFQYHSQYQKGKIPIRVFDDEDCIITIRKNSRKAVFYIKDKHFFDNLNIGDYFKYDSNFVVKSDHDIKTRLSREEYNRIKDER